MNLEYMLRPAATGIKTPGLPLSPTHCSIALLLCAILWSMGRSVALDSTAQASNSLACSASHPIIASKYVIKRVSPSVHSTAEQLHPARARATIGAQSNLYVHHKNSMFSTIPNCKYLVLKNGCIFAEAHANKMALFELIWCDDVHCQKVKLTLPYPSSLANFNSLS